MKKQNEANNLFNRINDEWVELKEFDIDSDDIEIMYIKNIFWRMKNSKELWKQGEK